MASSLLIVAMNYGSIKFRYTELIAKTETLFPLHNRSKKINQKNGHLGHQKISVYAFNTSMLTTWLIEIFLFLVAMTPNKQQVMYHVVFFDKKVSRTWVNTVSIRNFAIDDDPEDMGKVCSLEPS